MSFEINPIGGKQTPRANLAGPALNRAVTETPKAETGNKVAESAPVEGFKPTSEAKESLSDEKAGAAKASEILGAWSSNQGSSVASAGNLQVTGGANTNVNQVHGVSGGVYQSSNGAKPGFTEGTVYSNKPPFG